MTRQHELSRRLGLVLEQPGENGSCPTAASARPLWVLAAHQSERLLGKEQSFLRKTKTN
jgi:hypothetical protein